ncbi:amidohydrolase [Pyramidobacter sp. YE332]|uniref:M20 metallopeptidase family protein n=1 Tax=unclassified Pyramidobacter TaxID=2632171 RepID=UPI00098E8FE8|nr:MULTISPECIES: amidohydrolase [unclassified Pyramidobacter]OON87348.1 hypothetical protein B0D78_10235 [Pyramidobacter sp. C12-8]WOL40125.1 amidohydrolase [Pyramidobacter sp. YE332]
MNRIPIEDEIAALRRDLHRHPELSGQETRTAGLVAAELERLGLTVIRAPEKGNSLLGVLDTGRAGKTLALRADMDALPLQENACNLKGAKAVVSEIDGAAHMCGHDFHTAGMLAAARRLTAIKEQLAGRVIFCFESGEEMGLGDDARALLAELKPVDAIFGVHVQAAFPCGAVVVIDGSCTAGCETFAVKVRGKSAHGATPHLGLDPINCAAQILCGANSIISRRVNAREAAVLTVCNFHGGSTWNRIPDECRMEGSLRFFSEQVGRDLHALLEQTAAGTAAANGCTAEVHWRNWCPPSVNDVALAALARRAAEEIGAEVIAGESWMASETFARYREIGPEVLAFVGCANPDTGCGAPQHSDQFDADEDCLAVSAALTVQFAQEFLGEA